MQQRRHITIIVLSYFLVAGVALALRVVHLGVFVSEDEIQFWIPRSERFLQALQTGDISAMPVLGHPGVTTMWLGSAGIALRQFLFEQGFLSTETYPVLLALHRLPAALVNGIGAVVGYGMLRRLFPPLIAFLAAFLWAVDPFAIAYQRVLHVDGLAGTFVTLSLLAACLAWNRPHDDPPNTPHTTFTPSQWGWLAVSSINAGLAILSKSPALMVIPTVGIMALASAYDHAPPSTLPFYKRLPNRVYLLSALVWGMGGVAVIVGGWPAVWGSPHEAFLLLLGGVETEATSPHMLGNFFLGRPTDAPGIFFYPVAIALRLTPITLIGVMILGVVWRYARPSRTTARHLAVLAGFAILLTIGLSLFPKKFNRYVMPAFPALDILASAGVVWGLMWLRDGVKRVLRLLQSWLPISGCEMLPCHVSWERPISSRAVRLAVGGIAIFALFNEVWWHPYSIAAFNQLLGGAQAGVETFVVGWGEGYEQVADYLNQQPDITDVIAVSQWQMALNAYLREGAQSNGAEGGALPDAAGYVIVYIRHTQGKMPSPPYDAFYGKITPLHTVRLKGVDYAWIYDAPLPVDHRVNAIFGDGMRLTGYDVDTVNAVSSAATTATTTITLTTQWNADKPLSEDLKLFVGVYNQEGQRVQQIDVAPVGGEAGAGRTSQWDVGQFYQWNHPIPLPQTALGEAVPGEYWVGMAVYRPDDFARLPFTSNMPPPEAPFALDDEHYNLFFLPQTVDIP